MHILTHSHAHCIAQASTHLGEPSPWHQPRESRQSSHPPVKLKVKQVEEEVSVHVSSGGDDVESSEDGQPRLSE